MKKVKIVGAGIGGLVLAYRLLKKGCQVTVYEKEKEVGGLAAGFKIGDTFLEKTYHHIFRTDTDFIRLIEELGLTDKLEWYESSIGLYYGGKTYPFVSPVDLLNFKPLNLVDKLRLGLVKIYLEHDGDWKKYVGTTAAEWMNRWCGRRAYEVVWKPLLKGKFHRYYDKVSMAWLWARIHTRSGSRNNDGKERLGYMDGGFQILIDTLVERINEMKGKIVLNREIDIKAIEKDDQVVVYTGPAPGVDYLGAMTVVFTSNRDLSRFYWVNINDSHSPFVAFIQQTNFVDKKKYGGMNVYYLGTYLPGDHRYFRMSDEAICKKFLGYLKSIVGEFKVKNKWVFRFKKAQQIVTTDYDQRIPRQKVSAGIYQMNFAQIFPEDRGMNYAVREANKLSRIICSTL